MWDCSTAKLGKADENGDNDDNDEEDDDESRLLVDDDGGGVDDDEDDDDDDHHPVWMGDSSAALLSKAVGWWWKSYSECDDVLPLRWENGSTMWKWIKVYFEKMTIKYESYFLTLIGSPSSSLSPYSATRNLSIVMIKQMYVATW